MLKTRHTVKGLAFHVLQLWEGQSFDTPDFGRASVIVPLNNNLLCENEPCERLTPFVLDAHQRMKIRTEKSEGAFACLEPEASIAIWMYGSRAHGNELPFSDLDIMVAGPTCEESTFSFHGISVSVLSDQELLRRATKGELVVKSLCIGARPLIDPGDLFETLKSTFVPRTDYPRTKRLAADLAYLLIQSGLCKSHPALSADKMSWALRSTITAEGGDPFIDTSGLPYQDRDILQKVRQAKTNGNLAALFPAVAAFFARRSLLRILPETAGLNEFRDYFQDTNNFLGVQLVDEFSATTET